MRTWPALDVDADGSAWPSADVSRPDLFQAALARLRRRRHRRNAARRLARLLPHAPPSATARGAACRRALPRTVLRAARRAGRGLGRALAGEPARRPGRQHRSSRRRGTFRTAGDRSGTGATRGRLPPRHRHPAVDGLRHRPSRDDAAVPRGAAAARPARPLACSTSAPAPACWRSPPACSAPRRSWRSTTTRMRFRRRARTWR